MPHTVRGRETKTCTDCHVSAEGDNNAWGWTRLGWATTLRRRPDEALAHFERSLMLSPFDPLAFNVHFGMAMAWAIKGDYRRAVVLVEKGLRARPSAVWAYRMLAAFHANAGNDAGVEAGQVRALTEQHVGAVMVNPVDSRQAKQAADIAQARSSRWCRWTGRSTTAGSHRWWCPARCRTERWRPSRSATLPTATS